jgi:hypothetical protein
MKNFVWETDVKRPLRRPGRWKDNIETDLREVDCEDRRWMKVPEDSDQWC